MILGHSQQFSATFIIPVYAKFSVNWDLVIFQVGTCSYLKNGYVPVDAKFSVN